MAALALTASGCALTARSDDQATVSAHSGSPGSQAATSATTPPPLGVTRVTPTSRTLGPTAAITVTYTAPPADGQHPSLRPEVTGTWTARGNRQVFTPAGEWPAYLPVRLTVPTGTTATNGGQLAEAVHVTFHGPKVSLLRAQEVLARLGYLPLDFHPAEPLPATRAGERHAGYAPLTGAFTWRSATLRRTLASQWTPGANTVVTRGALIAFQADHHLHVDGLLGPHTWAALVAADLVDQVAASPYSNVVADLTVPQTVTVYLDGRPALSSPVNSGIAGARTRLGTFPVYRRVTSDTMRGTMPDGTRYVDRGVPWDSYFSGGQALHGFVRRSYGWPQSNGCLELPVATAHRVYGMLHLGSLITVVGDPTAHR